MEEPTSIKLWVPVAQAAFDTTAEPTIEGQNATSILGAAIATTEQLINVMDGKPNQVVRIDTSLEPDTFRIDLALNKQIAVDAFVLDTHNLQSALPNAIRDKLDVIHHTSDVVGSGTTVAPSKIFSGLLGKERPRVKYDGLGMYHTLAATYNGSDLDVGTHDYSYRFIFKVEAIGANEYLLGCYENVNNQLRALVTSTGSIAFHQRSGGTQMGNYLSTGDEISAGNYYDLLITVDRDDVVKFCLDGTLLTGVTESNAVTAGDVAIAASIYLGRKDTDYFNGEIALFQFWNRVPTSGEATTLYNSGKPLELPIPVADQYGAATELMPNQVDRDFSGASAWAQATMNTYDEAGDLTIFATAIGQYCELPVASAPMAAGRKYHLFYDAANVSSDWTVKDFTGVQTFGTIAADGTQDHISFTVDAGITGGLRLVATAANEGADFDNFSLIRVGCVLELNSDGLSADNDEWHDASTNDLHANGGGSPEYIDTPDDDNPGFYLIEFTEIDGELYWFFQIDPSGNDTELITDSDNRDFTGASEWTNVDWDTYTEIPALALVATAINQYCTLPVANAPMTAGFVYTFEFDASGIFATVTLRDFTGVQIFGTITANGANQKITFVVDSGITGGFRIVAVANDSAITLDNLSLKRLGALDDMLIGGTTPLKGYTFGDCVAGGYGGALVYGIASSEADSGRVTTEEIHGERPSWKLTWNKLTAAQWANLKAVMQIIRPGPGASLLPFYVTFDYDGAQPVIRRVRMQGPLSWAYSAGSTIKWRPTMTLVADI